MSDLCTFGAISSGEALPLGSLEVTYGERHGLGQDGSGVGLGEERRSQRLDRHLAAFICVLSLLEV